MLVEMIVIPEEMATLEIHCPQVHHSVVEIQYIDKAEGNKGLRNVNLLCRLRLQNRNGLKEERGTF